MTLTGSFVAFFESEKAGGLVLIACTVLALAIANSPLGSAYGALWHASVAGMTLEHWVNDGLMAVFFLHVGLELERELYVGELSDLRDAVLPVIAAAGGLVVPAAIHFAFNAGTPTQSGAGIPMATDIAFALGVLALLGDRVPSSLKVFLVALAVMDDLGAILVIALFYGAGVAWPWLGAALAVFAALLALNRLRVIALWPYLVGGALLWFLVMKSGVHATIAGVLLAFAIPFSTRAEDEASPSHRLEHFLHRPVAFGILPLFALANTGITIDGAALGALASANALGIALGLVVGKPVGITLATLAAVALGWSRLPSDLTRWHVVGAGLLGGIGFTMSIFVTNLAFAGQPDLIAVSKLAVLGASLVAGVGGYLWLRR